MVRACISTMEAIPQRSVIEQLGAPGRAGLCRYETIATKFGSQFERQETGRPLENKERPPRREAVLESAVATDVHSREAVCATNFVLIRLDASTIQPEDQQKNSEIR